MAKLSPEVLEKREREPKRGREYWLTTRRENGLADQCIEEERFSGLDHATERNCKPLLPGSHDGLK